MVNESTDMPTDDEKFHKDNLVKEFDVSFNTVNENLESAIDAIYFRDNVIQSMCDEIENLKEQIKALKKS